jgi:hypothetical protein
MLTLVLLLPLVAPALLEGGDSFGAAVAVVGDVDADGVADWVASDAWGPGVVEMRSGRTGQLIWTRSSTSRRVGFGQSLCAAGDWNGDGVPDVAVGCSPGPEEGADVFVASGKDGATIFTLPRRDARAWSDVVAGGFDLDGDAAPDLLLQRVVYGEGFVDGALEAWSGKRREASWSNPGTASTWIGQPVAASDVAWDLLPDVIAVERVRDATGFRLDLVLLSGRDGQRVQAWKSTSRRIIAALDAWTAKSSATRILVASTARHSGDRTTARIDAFERGRDAPLWTLALPEAEGDVDVSLCARHDLDGDGTADFVVGQRMAHLFSGRIDAYDGARRARLWSFENTVGEDFGYAVTAHPDIDADGVGDYLVSAACPYNSLNTGTVCAISGKSGRELYRVGRGSPRRSTTR